MPFRALQLVVDSLLRHAPHKARTEREREQADEVYKANYTIRVSLTQRLRSHVNFLNFYPTCADSSSKRSFTTSRRE